MSARSLACGLLPVSATLCRHWIGKAVLSLFAAEELHLKIVLVSPAHSHFMASHPHPFSHLISGDARVRAASLRAWSFLFTSLNATLTAPAVESVMADVAGLLHDGDVDVRGAAGEVAALMCDCCGLADILEEEEDGEEEEEEEEGDEEAAAAKVCGWDYVCGSYAGLCVWSREEGVCSTTLAPHGYGRPCMLRAWHGEQRGHQHDGRRSRWSRRPLARTTAVIVSPTPPTHSIELSLLITPSQNIPPLNEAPVTPPPPLTPHHPHI